MSASWGRLKWMLKGWNTSNAHWRREQPRSRRSSGLRLRTSGVMRAGKGPAQTASRLRIPARMGEGGLGGQREPAERMGADVRRRRRTEAALRPASAIHLAIRVCLTSKTAKTLSEEACG